MNKRSQLIILGVLVAAVALIGTRLYLKGRGAPNQPAQTTSSSASIAQVQKSPEAVKEPAAATPVVKESNQQAVSSPDQTERAQAQVANVPKQDAQTPTPVPVVTSSPEKTLTVPAAAAPTSQPVSSQPVQVAADPKAPSAEDIAALIREVAGLRKQVAELTQVANRAEEDRRLLMAELNKLRAENLQFKEALAAAASSNAGLIKQVQSFQEQADLSAAQAKTMELVRRRTFTVNP